MAAAGLVSLASLVRPGDEVSIIDEKVSGPVGDIEADVVGLSFKSMYARRAYRLADRLRARGIKVVAGGVHVSSCVEEAAAHVDVVVTGEGEGVWRTVLHDLERGKHHPVYHASMLRQPLDRLPPQPAHLLATERYMVHALQTARGCSFTCEFCPTRSIFGDGYRLRDLDAVVADAERFVAADPRPVFFTENVFGAGHRPFVDALTRRLSERHIEFAAICDWFVVNRPLVEVMARNGIGLVGINMTGRDEPKEEAAIAAFHEAGIPIWGYFMFGFEEDDPGVFEGAVAKVRRYDVRCVTPTVLAPYPGTPMAQRLEHEGRIFDHDTDLLDQHHVVFEPKNMSPDELRQGYEYVCRELEPLLSFDRAIEALRDRGRSRAAGA